MDNIVPLPKINPIKDSKKSITEGNSISLIGASGFIGRSLLKHLLVFSDVQVKVLLHTKDLGRELDDKTVLIPGDLMQPETLKAFIAPGDTVINLAYLRAASRQDNISAIRNLADACERANIKRLIHCSTARVAGRIHDKPITEQSICRPVSKYAAVKLDIEEEILKYAHSYEVVIVRPTAVFGPEGPNLVQFVHDLRCKTRRFSYIKSCLYGRSRQNLVFVDNVVAAIVFLITATIRTRRETFIISDDDAPSNNYGEIEKYFFKSFGWQDYLIPPVQLPLPMLACMAELMNKFNSPAACYDCGKIRQAGFNKPVPFEEGLSRFARWYEDEFLA